ncbi:hypothetical protein HU200_056483 [Digitaria exilis]|uniref:F-box associated beta-propeller type 3 domain-containing protein n=1 Tax=Digitaria exilis TaxID=1010633 RepID=A0A835AMG7_9POAL|nr:hypothetical protein HU200_056483 [Digitaria exilis]
MSAACSAASYASTGSTLGDMLVMFFVQFLPLKKASHGIGEILGSSVSGKLYPSDAIIFDEAWSPSKWALPMIGPDDHICGSCNGLLCLHTPTSTIKIANLATGECLHLKKPIKSLKDDHFSFYRFGFHPATKEYMVIHFFQQSSPLTAGRFNVIQVYKLGDDKWKDVITPESLSLNCVKNSGVAIVDGAMYWLAEDRESDWQHVVMSFHLGEESFAHIQLPEVDHEDWTFGIGNNRHYWITEIDGKVCISTAQSLEGILFGKLQIWMLTGQVKRRWSQKYNIHLLTPFARGLHFVHGAKIVIQHCNGNLYSCELLGKNFEIELNKMGKLLDSSSRREDGMQFYVCVKSLVPLDVYAKAAIVYRPKRLGEWKLKKWKEWEQERLMLEDAWRGVHQREHDWMGYRRSAVMEIKKMSQDLPDGIRQSLSLEMDRSLQHFPGSVDQLPNPIQKRHNWVEEIQDRKKLLARLERHEV